MEYHSSLIVFLVVNSLFFVHAVIHPSKNSNKGLKEPFIVDAELESNPEALFEAFNEEHSRKVRSVPSTTPYGFGTTVHLVNDSHTYGLVHWSGLPKERIFILTRKRSKGYSIESFLWISKNYGKSFENITSLFPSDAVAEWYYISSNADKLIFTDRINKRVYVTLDEGDTFNSHNLDFVPDKLLFQKSWVHNVSQYEDHVLGYYEAKKELWVSIDTGATWQKLGDNVTRYAWRELDSTYEDHSTVYFDMNVNDTTAMLYRAVHEDNGYKVYLFDDHLGPFMPSSFILSHQYMFVQKNYSQIGVVTTDSPLMVSHNRGMFKPAHFPLNIEERHYALVDASENQVLMAVYHNPNDTHIYISEEAGMDYTLSLNNIISPPENEWIDSYPTFDVYVVESLLGTYIANRKIPSSSYGSTVISFDKGGEWRPINPPAVDRNGQPLACNPPCSLHLRMFVNTNYYIQSILSQDSAPGIIMATGNIGTNILNSYFKLRLYMSDNGGVTWREVYNGFKTFQLLDYGVFTVVVDKGFNTYYSYISCDEGTDWKVYNFAEPTNPLRVVAMYTERGEKAQHVTIFGYYPNQKFHWLIIDLDFTTLNLTQCNGSDYYLWKPTDERPDQNCILGETIEYERRLPDRCCYIQAEYDRPINRTACECTAEDFECEVNFERVGLNGACTAIDGYQYPPDPPLICPETKQYNYTSGYRKISGDKCVQGKETFYLPQVQDCPVEAPGHIELSISDNEYSKVVGEEFTFTFTQGQGGLLSTSYKWSYGDNTSDTYTGYDNAHTTSHTYTYPGSYKVELDAVNAGGQGTKDIGVSVSDSLVKANIVTPTFIFVEAPTNFYASLSTKYGTDTLLNVKYHWTYDGQSVTKDTPYFSTMFLSPGDHQLHLLVSYVGGIVQDDITLSVMNPKYSLQITANVDSHSVSQFVPVKHEVTFGVKQSNGDTFSSSASFHWLILHGNGSHIYDQNITSSTVKFSLPVWGVYSVTVISHDQGEVATGSIAMKAEEKITKASFSLSPVYKINQLVNVFLNISTENFNSFTGTLEVTIWQGAVGVGSEITSGSPNFVLQEEQGVSVSFILIESGQYNVSFQVRNNITRTIASQQISVARSFQYEYFRLFFEPTDVNNNTDWLMKLQQDIINVLTVKFSLHPWQLLVNVLEEVDPSNNKRKREDSPELIAHVTLLPASLKSEDILLGFNISRNIINASNTGQLSFTVDGKIVLVTKADKGSSIIIVDPAPITKKSFLTLSISLGAGGLIVVLITVSIIIGSIVYYRKKYRSLEIRYSRLRQGPMRFTFTSDGENLEEEDWNDDDTKQDEQEDMEKSQKI